MSGFAGGFPDPVFLDPDNPDPELIAAAGRLLRDGGVIAHPSDTVYGLAAAAHRPDGVARLRALKRRDEERPFILLIDEAGRVEQLAHSIRRYAIPWISKIWPAPLTLILNGRPGTPGLAPDGSIALRCPAQALTRALVREVAGLMASTSANRAGERNVGGAIAALAEFGRPPDGLAMAIDGALSARGGAAIGPTAVASTIVDCRGEAPRVVRAGAVDPVSLGIG